MKRTMKKAAAFALLASALTAANSMTAFAGAWQKDAKGWWYQKDDGGYYKNEWQWIDGNNDGTAECYYFGADGYTLVNTTTPDGYTVNGDGAWVENGAVKTQGNVQTVQNGTMIQAGGFILEYDPAFADFFLLTQDGESSKKGYAIPILDFFEISSHNNTVMDCRIEDAKGKSQEEIKKRECEAVKSWYEWLGKDKPNIIWKDYMVNGQKWFGYELNGTIWTWTFYSNRVYAFTYGPMPGYKHETPISMEKFIGKIRFTNDFSTIFINADGEIKKSESSVGNIVYSFQLKSSN